MAESFMPQEHTANRPRYTTVRVLGVFVIAMFTMSLITALQHRRRDVLETTHAPTGVGDKAFFQLTRPIIWKRDVAKLDGTALYLQSEEPTERADTQMRKVAWWRQFHVYEDATAPNAYFLKVSKGRYLPVSQRPRDDLE